MDTPWGDLPVSDAHIHFFSHRFFAALAEQKGLEPGGLGGLLEWTIPGPDPAELANAWISEMDRHGVEKAALIASAPGDRESVIAAVALHPNRFRGYLMVDPTAAANLENAAIALASGSIHGLCFFPAMHRYSMQDERALALLDAADRHCAVAFVHCGVLSVGIRKKLGLPSLFDMRFSNPIDLHAIALRFPKVRFVVPHFGAGYFREALMLCDLCPNVWLDTSSTNQWMRYYEPSLDLRAVLRRALAVVSPDRLVFGSDSSFFPRGWNSGIFLSQAKALYELGVEPDIAQKIFHDNFDRLFS